MFIDEPQPSGPRVWREFVGSHQFWVDCIATGANCVCICELVRRSENSLPGLTLGDTDLGFLRRGLSLTWGLSLSPRDPPASASPVLGFLLFLLVLGLRFRSLRCVASSLPAEQPEPGLIFIIGVAGGSGIFYILTSTGTLRHWMMTA